MYSYHPAGAVVTKQVQFTLCGQGGDNSGCSTGYAEADYTYNSAGQVASYGTQSSTPGTYTGSPSPETIYSYRYDGMGRPLSLTDNVTVDISGQSVPWAQGAQYDFAGWMVGLQTGTWDNGYVVYTTEARTYNVNGQLTQQSWSSAYPGFNGGKQYVYAAGANNGQISQMVDATSGENVSYQYDALERLISASGSPRTGSTPAAWSENFQYDGFGNLTAKVLNGTTTSIPVTAATNRLANATYDANGNMTSGAGATLTYDSMNRVVAATEFSGGTEYYGYAPDNKRIMRLATNGTMEITLYGALGEKLQVYNAYLMDDTQNGVWAIVNPVRTSVWFAGKLVSENGLAVNQDRLGTNRAGGRYYPYGEGIGTGGVPTTAGSNTVAFATYTRDSWTGLDYADQRFYASSYGRYATVDPTRY